MSTSTFKIGDRVELIRAVDRFPDFIADKGLTGTVTSVSASDIWVKADQPIKGAEEWDNEIQWSDVTIEELHQEVRHIR